MTDSQYIANCNLEIIDCDWLADCLSDDELDLPAQFLLPAQDIDFDPLQSSENLEPKFLDLHLESFFADALTFN